MKELRVSISMSDEKGVRNEVTFSLKPAEEGGTYQPTLTALNRETGFEAVIKLPKASYNKMRETLEMVTQNPGKAEQLVRRFITLLSLVG